MAKKMSRGQFVRAIALRRVQSGKFAGQICKLMDISEQEDEISAVLDEIVDGIVDCVMDGYDIVLPKFGVFSMKIHKGHPTQFGSGHNSPNGYKDDYPVLKFSASGTLNKIIGQKLRKGIKDDGTKADKGTGKARKK